MKKLLLSLFCLFTFALEATHLIGGEITYTCLGGDQYEIKVIVYRDCGPTNTNETGFDGAGVITIYNSSNNYISQFQHGNPYEEYVVDVFTNECLELPSELCVEKGTYTIIATLPSNGQGYQIVYQRCCRNTSVVNIQDPEIMGSTLIAFIPSVEIADCNNSPEFIEYPPLALCLGSDIEVSQSAWDADGDSLVYSFVAPFDGASFNDPNEVSAPPFMQVPWESGYTDAYPIDSDPVVTIDSQTGYITGTPSQGGYYVVAVKVEEFRDGVYLGYIMRDFRFLVVDCDVSTAAFPIADIYCEGLTVGFENNSVNAFDYYWEFGDQTTTTDYSSFVEPVYTYPDSGLYTVTLVANPNSICSDTAHISFSLYPDLYPDFEVPEPDCSVDALYDFYGEGIIPPNADFTWDFGLNAVNQFSDELNPQAIEFNSFGVQQVSFTVTYLGCEETYATLFVVEEEDVVSIEVSESALCEPALVTFEATTLVDGEYIYDWNLGASQFSDLSNPTVEYQSGTYDISLTVLNLITGCESTVSEQNYIVVHPLPQAQIESSSLEGCAPLLVNFDNLSEDADSYEWLVDGVLVFASVDFSESFEIGQYQVTLQAISDFGCQTDYASLNVSALPVVDADFSLDYMCNENLQVQINNNSSYETDLYWSFGDGPVVQGTPVFYDYAQEGDYFVSLIATNPNSCNLVDSALYEITIAAPPIVDFAFELYEACEDGLVQLDNLSQISDYDEAISWNWNFDDGVGSNDFESAHLYDTEGVYNLSLSVETALGCEGFAVNNVEVFFHEVPSPEFNFEIDTCNHQVSFFNQSVNASSYVWDFGNGMLINDFEPILDLQVGGYYTIILTAYSEFCGNSTLLNIDYTPEALYAKLSIPNVFTPNGDDKNDEMLVKGLRNCEAAMLKVFNRWGAEVYYTLEPIVEPWDGLTINDELSEGVYFYILELEFMRLSGDVTIFR